jgi:nitrous oxide reductase accessory protein NosL
MLSHTKEEHMKRKKAVAVLAAAAIFGVLALVAFAQQDDIKQSASCRYCGMDRQKFDFSRMMIDYEDGSSTGVCSLHCAAVELALNIDKTPTAIKVGDFGTKNLIDAEKAAWVLGGSKPGVMTKRGKWAFEKKEDAEAFIKANGGELTSFDNVIKAAYTDMYEDTKMIREKRKMKKQQGAGGMEHKH